jgi:hypothetical protein
MVLKLIEQTVKIIAAVAVLSSSIAFASPMKSYTSGNDEFQALVGPCPGNGCGNPNDTQQHSSLEFPDTAGPSSTTVISEGTSANFEADHETVGSVSSPDVAGPAPIAPTPEPDSLVLAFAGAALILLGMGVRRFSLIPTWIEGRKVGHPSLRGQAGGIRIATASISTSSSVRHRIA